MNMFHLTAHIINLMTSKCHIMNTAIFLAKFLYAHDNHNTHNTSQMKSQKVDGKSAKVVNPLLSHVRQ